MISPISKVNNINNKPSFKSRNQQLENRLVRYVERADTRLQRMLATLSNRLEEKFLPKSKILERDEFLRSDEQSSEYITGLKNVAKSFAANCFGSITPNKNHLKEIAKSSESSIFIMNHDHPLYDSSTLSILNYELLSEYEKAGRLRDFPHPKVLLTQEITKALTPLSKEVFKKFGAVEMDIDRFEPNRIKNALKLVPIIRDFSKNKSNIFIFPEGRLAGYKNVPFETRFQSGVSEMALLLCDMKKEVKINPVGFAYTPSYIYLLDRNIHLGSEVKLKKENGKIFITGGEIGLSNYADKCYKNIFDNSKEEFIEIADKNTPKKDTINTIQNILCENLKICKKEAEKGFNLLNEREMFYF